MYSVLLSFKSGAHGTATLGWSLPRGVPGWGIGEFTVIGEDGVVSVRQGELGFLEVRSDGPTHRDVFFSPEVHGRMRRALAAEVDHFLQCVQGSAQPLCSAGDGVEAVRVALAMEQAAASGSPVAL